MAHDLQLDLDVLLPDAHGHDDRCVADLIAVLEATNGVEEAHVIEPSNSSPARLCISVEPGRVSLRRLADKARSAGAEISARYGHAIWQVRGMTHATRADNASAILRRLPGVLDAVVMTGGATRIEFDRTLTDEPGLRRSAADSGITVEGPPVTVLDLKHNGRSARERPEPVAKGHDHTDHDHGVGDVNGHEGHTHGGPSELVVAAGAFIVYLIARTLDWTTTGDAVPTVLYVAVALVTGLMVGRDVLTTVRARRFDIEMLMLAAAAGAAALGDWSDAALLLALFSLGHSLEGFAMSRARREIESLADLAPPIAHRRTGDGSVEEVPLEALCVGDVLVVKPNERISADGVVVDGTSTVDEAPVTGESTPVDKMALPNQASTLDFDHLPRQHRVFSGTLNGPRVLEVQVARTAADSTLARVVRLVSEAETQVSPTQRQTQKIVRFFVPAVLMLVAVLLVVPLAMGSALRPTFLRAMAVLVASSPCALAIATPSAVLAGIARAARDGVLVKGGGPLETLGQVCTMAFDKTGTLTEGRPRLVAVEPAPGTTIPELLAVVVAVESQSDHPLARAITTDAPTFAPDMPILSATDVKAEIGRGVTATVEGRAISIGNSSLAENSSIPEAVRRAKGALQRTGSTTMLVTRDGTTLGVLAVMDSPRDEASDTVRQLRELGIHWTIMLSGDNQSVADAVAAQVGVDEARGALLPQDKVAAIRELAAQHKRGVAMVGDGVNDAPALASASVGIAMGAAGSAVALETADIALMGDQLDRLPFAVRLARHATRVIRQNLFISLGMVMILIPLTLIGIGIGPAVIAHEGSTVLVVANALRLLAHVDRRKGDVTATVGRESQFEDTEATARNIE